MGRERTQFGDRLVPPTQQYGFPVLYFFEVL
jgi:hypothetical protein